MLWQQKNDGKKCTSLGRKAAPDSARSPRRAAECETDRKGGIDECEGSAAELYLESGAKPASRDPEVDGTGYRRGGAGREQTRSRRAWVYQARNVLLMHGCPTDRDQVVNGIAECSVSPRRLATPRSPLAPYPLAGSIEWTSRRIPFHLPTRSERQARNGSGRGATARCDSESFIPRSHGPGPPCECC